MENTISDNSEQKSEKNVDNKWYIKKLNVHESYEENWKW